MNDLYRELIIDRYKNPLYRGVLDPHDITFEDSNPLCGDHIRIDLRVGEDGRVSEAAFDGHGCAISQASADLLLESVIGLPTGSITGLRTDTINGRSKHWIVVEHESIPECSDGATFERIPECDPVIHKSVEDQCFVCDWNMRDKITATDILAQQIGSDGKVVKR